MTKEVQKEFNTISTALYINLYTLSKESRKIELKNFNPKAAGHIYLLHLANSLSKMYNWPIYTDLGFIGRIRLYVDGCRVPHGYKRRPQVQVDCDTIISDVLTHYPKNRFEECVEELLGDIK